MHSKEQFFSSLFRTVSLVVVAASMMAVAIVPARAQNAVPPTAVQAAKMPQFASRLAHPAKPQAAGRPAAFARPGMRRGPLDSNDVYDNGPINGNTDAWTINFGFIVSDTFTLANDGAIVTGMSFGAWLNPGDTQISAEVSITSGINGGTSYFSQTVNFTQSGCAGNEFGYNVCTETASFNGPALSNGTYWVNLQNATVTNGDSGDPIYWDENSGVGCQSPGCPSQADENTIGTIPSESFTILGSASTTTYPPPACFTGGVQVLQNLTAQEGGTFGGAGVAIDPAGNLYGTTLEGGDYAAGFAYKLARWAGWVLDPLYSFAGGNNGGGPGEVIVGPNGSLYGGAFGGIPNCGSDGSEYCGLIYNLTPSPTACLTALCSWTEKPIYQFTGNTDAWRGSVSAFDSAGNLYGTGVGGAYGYGAVFELMPSPAGWTEKILYSFTGSGDGSIPTQVLVGNDGNLYGLAGGGAYGDGVVFQLTPSGSGWTESVLHSFQGSDGQSPSYLGQDSAGNLYGMALIPYFDTSPPIFTLQKSGEGWVFNEYFVHHPYGNYEFLSNLTVDAAGNLYGTGYGGEGCSGGRCKGSLDSYPYVYAYIFKASYGSGGWQYQDLVVFSYEYFLASGPLALDAQGNLYGTTSYCGTYDAGTVWELSP
jgi:uncharacterized repeat protein (TIGR03803 family)